jgi:hypothetical protein
VANWREQHRLEVFVPIPRGRETDARQVFEALKTELAKRYGGVTAYAQAPAEGLWSDGGVLAADRVVVLEVMIDQLELDDWAALKADLEKRLDQEEILIRATAVRRLAG